MVEVDAALGAGAEDRRRRLQRLSPRPRCGAAASRHGTTRRRARGRASGHGRAPRPPSPGSQPNLRDSGHSAPAQSNRKRQNTLRAGRGAADLLDLGLAVDREQADAEREGARDVALLLDGVAEGDAVGRGAGREHHLDLGDRGGVEAGAERGEERQQLRRRIRLHGVEHPAVRAAPWRRSDSSRARRRDRRRGRGHRPDRLRGGGAESLGCARSSESLLHPGSGAPPSSRELGFGPALQIGRLRVRANVRRQRLRAWRRAVRWGHGAGARLLSRRCCLGLERENPFRTAGKTRWTSLFGVWLLDSQRDQKSPLRRCFKPRPPLSAGCAGFASGCRSRSEVESLERPASTSGDCPASCPDAHRSTHGHRHVRIWASGK